MVKSLEQAIADNRTRHQTKRQRPDVTLSTGRVVRHEPNENCTVVMADGGEMSGMEWAEYCEAIRPKPRKANYAMNPDTHEVYERTTDKDWKAKLSAWIDARRARKHDYHATVIPCPMPWGHVMFDRKKDNHYKPLDALPVPVWSDGVGCLYEGQRVGWVESREHTGYPNYHYGNVVGFRDGLLTIQTSEGAMVQRDPYQLG
jgi:hypothetical protein